jgi:hypothetical protein
MEATDRSTISVEKTFNVPAHAIHVGKSLEWNNTWLSERMK